MLFWTAGCDLGKTVTNEGQSDRFTMTASGLKYHVTREGNGPKPTATDTVSVHYRGTLESGMEFDSSFSRGGPAQLPLAGVIAGWREGLQLVGVGGEIELIIPSDIAYGAAGNDDQMIPPNAKLHFTVELLEIIQRR